MTSNKRSNILASFTSDQSVIEELLGYNQPHFQIVADQVISVPLADEPFVSDWQRYLARSKTEGVLEALREPFIQLDFPIEAGIHQTQAYQAAVKKGQRVQGEQSSSCLEIQQPLSLRLEMHTSSAGSLPVITSSCREDFETLLRALLYKNEPVDIPASQGAAMLAGYANWNRVQRLQEQWMRGQGSSEGKGSWEEEFKKIIADKSLYQDRFILLSDGAYSAVPSEMLALSKEQWEEKSWLIRRSHECAHYFTKRVFGSMKNLLIDEIIADCAGIIAAEGRYRADWFLTCMGLEKHPQYRPGGRLENYRGNPPLSDEAFVLLQKLVVLAAGNIETVFQQYDFPSHPLYVEALAITGLASLSLEEMAGAEARKDIQEALTAAARRIELGGN